MTVRVVPDGERGRAAAVEALSAGGIVAFPTDTVYGIGVAPTTDRAIERLFAAKGRPPDRAVILLLANADQAAELALPTRSGDVLAAAFWPGGLTLVLPRRPDGPFPLALRLGDEAGEPVAPSTIGLRVPDHPTPRALAAAIGPLPTTSANRSGEPEARDATEIEADLGETVALILNGGPAPGGPPSTVVDATTDAVRIIRLGAVGAAALGEVLRRAGLPEPVGR